jgi:hypothetical protein
VRLRREHDLRPEGNDHDELRGDDRVGALPGCDARTGASSRARLRARDPLLTAVVRFGARRKHLHDDRRVHQLAWPSRRSDNTTGRAARVRGSRSDSRHRFHLCGQARVCSPTPFRRSVFLPRLQIERILEDGVDRKRCTSGERDRAAWTVEAVVPGTIVIALKMLDSYGGLGH